MLDDAFEWGCRSIDMMRIFRDTMKSPRSCRQTYQWLKRFSNDERRSTNDPCINEMKLILDRM